ncbi:hypothetical protein BGZ70_005796 [Mortierella alpina]|uniref:Uncharacterized protein n=1 Tax=Mortierella alpina TaxID=64518 RepID=A0A9P6JAQ9_MORAP|nr:hypothetical protein BGZ70_005796 [Mortierella alpina]
MLKSLGGLIWGHASDKDGDEDRVTGIMLHAGQFYIYRPHHEGLCIYIDAQVIVQRTAEPYVSHGDDAGVYYRFVCDDETTNYHANNFEITVYQCMYEQKYQRSYTTAHEDDFREFEIRSSAFATQFLLAGIITNVQEDGSSATSESSLQEQEDEDSEEEEEYEYACVAEFPGALHLFDVSQKQFTPRGSRLSCQLLRDASISENSTYWLSIVDVKDRQQLCQRVDTGMALIFNPSNCGFIWNTPGDRDAEQYTWLFKLKDEDSLTRFRTIVSRCIYEVVQQNPESELSKVLASSRTREPWRT